MQLIRHGESGPAVTEIRSALHTIGLLDGATAAPYDATCDLAVRTFQQQRGLLVDGVVGPATYRAITQAKWRLGDRVLGYVASHETVGDDVAELQSRLLELGYDAGRPDGLFGSRTERALRAFQRDYGMKADGTFGPATMRALRQLGRKVVGGRPQLLRESSALVTAGPQLIGKQVVIDPAHGGRDPGVTVNGLREADIVWDLANRLVGRLAAAGVGTILTRAEYANPGDDERARIANSVDADLLISLHIDANPSAEAEGVATYHFGTSSGLTSTVGERLAGLVQREVVARTNLRDCHTHAKTWDLLRLTQMPSIQLEAGYLSHPGDRQRLGDPGFRDTVAEAVLVAVQRLYLPADVDPPTGTYRIPSGV